MAATAAAIDTTRTGPSAGSATTAPASAGTGPSAATTAATTTPAAPAARQPTSLYVGDLNPDVTESDLFSTFNAIAEVQNVRVCRDAQSHESRGYAYVNYKNSEDAQRALQQLNYSNIKGRSCRIMWVQRDPTARRDNIGNVFVKNLGPKITVKELHETFKLFGPILSCKVATDPKTGMSKGYGFVHFQKPESAQEAITHVNGLEWDGHVVECKPYVARTNRSGPEYNNLYVKNVPKEWTEATLQAAFAPYGEITSAVISKDEAGKSKGFGFVCYKVHTSAVEAEKEMNGKEVEGTPAKPSPFKPAAAAAASEGDASASASTAGAGASSPAEASGKMKLYVGRALKKAERERQRKEAVEQARRDLAQARAHRNLWVGNLDETVDDDLLRKEFSKYGSVESAVVSRDPANGNRSRLFGYVLLSTQEEADKAVAAMNHKMLQGKPLTVRLWQSKEERTAAREAMQKRRAAIPGGAGVGGAAMAGGGAAGLPGGATSTMAANNAAAAMQALNAHLPRLLHSVYSGSATPQEAMMLQQYMMWLGYVNMMQQQQRMPGGSAAMTPAAAAAAAAAAASASRGGAAVPGAAVASGPVASRAGAVPGMAGPAATMGMGGFPMVPGFGGIMVPQVVPGVPAVAGGVPTAAGAAPRGAPGAGRGGGSNVRAAAGRGGAAAGSAAAGTRSGVAVTSPGGGRAPTAASVVRGGAPAGSPAGAAYRPGARNTEEAVATAAVPIPAAAAPPMAASASFPSELAAADPEKRKNMIGEKLYSQIAVIDREKAGKITGMLLESIDESELIHLLEASSELEARVREAQQVLLDALKPATQVA